MLFLGAPKILKKIKLNKVYRGLYLCGRGVPEKRKRTLNNYYGIVDNYYGIVDINLKNQGYCLRNLLKSVFIRDYRL